MSAITLIQLYEILASRWGKEIAETVTIFIELKTSKEMENKIQVLATKDDLTKLEARLIRWVVSLFITLALMIIGLYLRP